MSTRVQKGSAVFRPVSKPRTRPSSVSVPPSTPVPEFRNPPVSTDVHNAPISTISLPPMTPPSSFLPPENDLNRTRPESTTLHTVASTIAPTFESREPTGGPNGNMAGPSGLRRARKSRTPSVSQSTVEEIDPTVTTMAALCSDTGTGRISSKAAEIQSNHAAWRASNRERRARMKLLMESKKYGRDHDEDGRTTRTITPASEKGPIAGPSTATVTPATNGEGFDYSQDLATSRYNVQVRIGPNGETIIDEESLFVDRNEDENTENYTHIEESDTTKFVNSGTYGKKFRGSRWSAEETERFYSALAQFGENYELISYVLPGRDRKSCKNKFKAEDKKNSSRITYCLNNRIPYDIQTLARMTGMDFSGPVPEIHARAPLTLAEPSVPNEPVLDVNKKSDTPIRDDDHGDQEEITENPMLHTG